MNDRERSALRERKAVFDDITNDTKSYPLTLEELRRRLKHIAGLCWGLSIDLANELEERDRLQKENAQLKEQIFLLTGKRPNTHKAETERRLAAMSDEERRQYEKRLAQKREYAAKRRKQKIIESYGGNNG